MTQKFLPRGNPALYEINTAAWLFELSKKLGKKVLLGDVPSQEWDKLKSLGMDFVWLMGVWNRSQEGRKVSLNSPEFDKLFRTIFPACTPEDIIGSCYSISSYGPDPLIGSWEDLDRAKNELHQRGMGLILDFVPNHTGIDHHWVYEHPEYYIQGTDEDYRKDPDAFFIIKRGEKPLYIAHGKDPNFPPWTDTAQLNYFNPEARRAMIDRIKNISRYCDGIRCDMAMLVLNDIFERDWEWANGNPVYQMPEQEFWTQVAEQVPDLVYIAEAYWDTEWRLQQLGFDFVYDKRLYDRLKSAHPRDVYLHLTASLEYQKKLVRFIENHDELRSITAFGRSKAKAAAVVSSTLPGMKLFFHGQFEGKQIRLPLQIRQSRTEPVDIDMKSFYDKLLPAVDEKIFHEGEWQLKEALPDGDGSAENLIAYRWKMNDTLRLVVVNLSQHPSQGRLGFHDEVSDSEIYRFKEQLTGQGFSQEGKLLVHPGLTMKLAGYQAQVWEITAKA